MNDSLNEAIVVAFRRHLVAALSDATWVALSQRLGCSASSLSKALSPAKAKSMTAARALDLLEAAGEDPEVLPKLWQRAIEDARMARGDTHHSAA